MPAVLEQPSPRAAEAAEHVEHRLGGGPRPSRRSPAPVVQWRSAGGSACLHVGPPSGLPSPPQPGPAAYRGVPRIAEDTAVLFSTASPLESHGVSDHEAGDDIREARTKYRRFPELPDGRTIAEFLERFEPPLKAGFKDFEETAADAGPPPDSEAGTAPGGAPARPRKRRDCGADGSRKRRKKAPGKGAGGSESAPPAAAVSSAAGVSNLSVCTLILL